MYVLNRVSIRTRLMASFCAIAALLAISAVLSLSLIDQVHGRLKTVYLDRTKAIQSLAEINYLMVRNRVLVLDMQQRPDQENLTKRSVEILSNVERVGKAWDAYKSTAMAPDEERLAAQFIAVRSRYVKEGILPAMRAMQAGKLEESLKVYSDAIHPIAPMAQKALDELILLQTDVAKNEYEQATEDRATAMKLTIGASSIGIAAALCFAWLVTRSITKPLALAIDFSEQIKNGNLRARIDNVTSDELGVLSQALREMQGALSGLVLSVRENAHSVATASVQIALGNSDLSQRTEEQASALEQTAATMSQLDAAVQNNANNARDANELAHAVAKTAIRGREVVGEVVSSMGEISSASARISEIIGTIDQIAFQTNILALNAAVEAARAGEQGRGFAVVAGEVRALAQRCAAAAKDVKTLIGASAVSVEKGTSMVEHAGSTMAELLHSIEIVTSRVAGIAAASVQQANGIRQVSEAISQMDRVTQQNSALVEQSAAAAESLKHQSSQLVDAVARFQA
ncbi:methyl-accepting chemotaxis protein [Roseateles sp.]|uniref:methyl-accepting chemotaxis protein n=1 Tax=Roseateles sp. TaxID=1971397 RepID=UPI003D0BD2A2